MNKQFIDDVKLILSGNIGTDDPNVIDYIALKIDRLHHEYIDQFLVEIGRDPGYIVSPEELQNTKKLESED